jgi:PIN domain nuclease of toxin-antitoxin system
VILLDTHCALWVELAPEKLSEKAKARLLDAEGAGEALAISCISLWEIAQMDSRNQLELSVSRDRFLAELEADFEILPVDRRVVLHAARLGDPFPKDPMEKLIVGTALANDLTLITADGRIRTANVCNTLW